MSADDQDRDGLKAGSLIGVHGEHPCEVNAETVLYAVIGNPIAHSLSPVMHNAAFSQTGINAIYLAFKVTDVKAATAGIRSLGVAGVSVTIPHKTDVVKQLDQIDPFARAIGAVNTIVNKNGQLIGYNTDGMGAVHALREKVSLKDKRVMILGAGGTARAIGYAVMQEGARVTIVNRTRKNGENLAKDLTVDFLPLQDFNEELGEVLVNTTPVGMAPHDRFAPIDETMLRPEMVVMDAIYNPLKTRLLRSAGRIGCTTISGVDMFVHQGAAQFERWTGCEAPLNTMRSAVLRALQKRLKR